MAPRVKSPSRRAAARWQSALRTVTLASALLALSSALLGPSSVVSAQRQAGAFEVVQTDSLASAMMLALIDQNNVMIIDKAENNEARLPNGSPVWGSVLNLRDNSVRGIEMTTNPFCASGAVMGNGTWMVAGGNQPVGYGGGALNGVLPQNGPYKDFDGRLTIRLMDPVTDDSQITWQDNAAQMTSPRWYPGIEVMTDGTVLLIGGAIGGGYINRNTPNIDPAFQAGGAASVTNMNFAGSNPTWEFFPSRGNQPTIMNFMRDTSGLNMYPHTFLLPSGKLFMQANYSTTLWDPYADNEGTAYDPLEDMPNQIIRVYPASAATAMLPLTPANNYTPTILFCGGVILTDDQWGNYTGPQNVNLYNTPAQTDCSSITPEDAAGNLVSRSYTKEEDLPEPRSMGQFVHLPTGEMVIVNGAQKGTAGYGNTTWNSVNGINFEGLANDPAYLPVLYDPSKPMGKRLSRDGFSPSRIARLYHSSAILIPDGSVMIAGSNPHQDVSVNMPTDTTPQAFNTTYEVEKWYPPYFFKDRPEPQGLPSFVLYGGNTWNFTMDAGYMGDSANFKAQNTKVMVIRPGFSTHAMNMGQRSLQLEHTYTVNDDGTVSYMVNPMPTNQNLFVQGPALLFVTIDGVPSVGQYIQVGMKQFGGFTMPNKISPGKAPSALPQPVNNAKFDAIPAGHGIKSFGVAKLAGIVAAAVAIIAVLILGVVCWRRRGRKNQANKPANAPAAGAIYGMGGYGGPEYKRVHTPSNTPFQGFADPARGSTGTFDTYKMQDVSGANSPYYDHPPAQPHTPSNAPRSPMLHPHHSESSRAPSQQSYASQGWGEHQAQGDVGEQYYNNSSYSDPARFYDRPQPQQQQHYSQQGSYGAPRSDSHQGYFRGS